MAVITIRMSADQHVALKEAAHKSRRSMNEFAMMRLFPEAEFPNAPGDVPPDATLSAPRRRNGVAAPTFEQVPGDGQSSVPAEGEAERARSEPVPHD